MDILYREYTLSFKPDREKERGDIPHNLRKRDDGNFRQRGDIERRDWNKYWVHPDCGNLKTNPDKLVINFLKKRLSKALDEKNQHYIARHDYKKVKTMEEWYAKQCVSHSANSKGIPKRGYNEFILGFGYKITAAPYVYKTDETGMPVDENGKPFGRWDTRKRLVPELDANGHKIKSKRYDFLVKRIEKCVKQIQKDFPEIVIISWAIHADEYGQIHCHIDWLGWVPTTGRNKGLGYTIAKTAAYTAICDRLGLKCNNRRQTYDKDTNDGNCATLFTKYMNDIYLRKFMHENDMRWVDGKTNGRPPEPIPEFKMSQDYRCAQIEAEIKSREAAVEKQRLENERIRKANETQSKIVAARLDSISKKEAAVDHDVKLATEHLAKAEALMTQGNEYKAKAKQQLMEAQEKNKKADENELALERWQRNLEEMSDDLIHKHNELNTLIAKAKKITSNANIEMTLYEQGNLDNQVHKAKNSAQSYKLSKDRQELEAEKAEVEKNRWIIDKVLEEHPEWLKAKEKEYVVYVRKLKGEMTISR